MYNKIRLSVMLLGFTFVTIIGVSYSGNVSGSCRSEWNFNKVNLNSTGNAEKYDHTKASNHLNTANKLVKDESSVKEVVNAEGYYVEESVGKRLSGFDLVFTDFLFAF